MSKRSEQAPYQNKVQRRPNKHTKRYIIRHRGTQIKTTMKYHSHLLKWLKSKTLTSQMSMRIWSNRNSHSLLHKECKWYSYFTEDGLAIFMTLNTFLPFDSAITLQDIYPHLKIYIHTKTSMQMFIASLFIIAKNEK